MWISDFARVFSSGTKLHLIFITVLSTTSCSFGLQLEKALFKSCFLPVCLLGQCLHIDSVNQIIHAGEDTRFSNQIYCKFKISPP